MAIILQKDKKTGETLVCETTNFRDKKTGKSGTRKELLGVLYPFTMEQNYADVCRMFDEAPLKVDDLQKENQAADEAMDKANRILEIPKAIYSKDEVAAIVNGLVTVNKAKDLAFNKLADFTKKVAVAAAEEVRCNDRLTEENNRDWESAGKDSRNVMEMKRNIEIYEKMIANYEQMNKLSKDEQSKKSELIAAQDKYIKELEAHKEIQDTYIEKQKACIDSQNAYIESQNACMENKTILIEVLNIYIDKLLDDLEKYEDVTKLRINRPKK